MEPNTSADIGGKILAYFSHSYREADRDVNSFFWELFHDEAFFFTVDPQSQLFSICLPRIDDGAEQLLRGCDYTQGRYTTRLFSIHSFRVWAGAAGPEAGARVRRAGDEWLAVSPDPERIVPFNRNPERLADYKVKFIRAIQSLASKVRGYRNLDVRLRQPCGLVIRTGSDVEQIYTPALIRSLTTELRNSAAGSRSSS